MTTIITKNSSTAGAAPLAADLVQGELAVNVTSKALYTKNASAAVVKLNTPSIVDNGDATAITIDSSENVGIGTSSPTNALAVYRGAGVAAFIDLTGNGNTAGTSNVVVGQNADDGGYFWNRKSAILSFGTNNTERARIDSSGNLLVAKTTTSTTTRGVYLAASSGALNSAQPSGGVAAVFTDTGSGSQIGAINLNGTGTSYATSSDYRLKENVQPMTGALSVVQQLKPCTYTWKADGSDGQGFIAHELQAVVPDCVTGEKDAVQTYIDEEGNEQTRPVYQGIDTSFLVATLTAAIQELKSINDTQAQAIATLTERITALEAK